LLGFAMLAAMDALLGLGRTDLGFDGSEAADLLAAHGLDSRQAAQYAARSDGWATGVLLFARAAPGGMRFLHTRQDVLMEQLGGQVLAPLPDALRRFLLESAALGPVTASEADAILHRHDSASLFAEALARDLFIAQEREHVTGRRSCMLAPIPPACRRVVAGTWQPAARAGDDCRR
jgi:LuxR family maltose regulon positive regulatory protein